MSLQVKLELLKSDIEKLEEPKSSHENTVIKDKQIMEKVLYVGGCHHYSP